MRRVLVVALTLLAASCGAESEAPARGSIDSGADMTTPETRGRRAYSACAVCHEARDPAAGPTSRLVGPNLWGVYGRRAGALPEYDYSRAFASLDTTWTDETLDAFLEAPLDYVPGTRMSYAGEKDPGKRADLVAYLKTLQ